MRIVKSQPASCAQPRGRVASTVPQGSGWQLPFLCLTGPGLVKGLVLSLSLGHMRPW